MESFQQNKSRTTKLIIQIKIQNTVKKNSTGTETSIAKFKKSSMGTSKNEKKEKF